MKSFFVSRQNYFTRINYSLMFSWENHEKNLSVSWAHKSNSPHNTWEAAVEWMNNFNCRKLKTRDVNDVKWCHQFFIKHSVRSIKFHFQRTSRYTITISSSSSFLEHSHHLIWLHTTRNIIIIIMTQLLTFYSSSLSLYFHLTFFSPILYFLKLFISRA